jgi:hypothetical protein
VTCLALRTFRSASAVPSRWCNEVFTAATRSVAASA